MLAYEVKSEEKADSLFKEIIVDQDSDKSDDISSRLDSLTKSIDNLQKLLDSLISGNNYHLSKKSYDVINEEKTTSSPLGNNIIKYSKIAKTTAHVIELLANGLIMVVESINENGNESMTSAIEPIAQVITSKKPDMSGILKSVESLIGNLATTVDKSGKQSVTPPKG